MKTNFQLILKRSVYPEYFVLTHLYPIIESESLNIGDFDRAAVKSWISLDYQTCYEGIDRRLVGFSLDLPEEIGSFKVDESSETETKIFIDEKLGLALADNTDFVESILRYRNDNILEEINKYHPEIFELEMRLREAINYILIYNLKHHGVNNVLSEFKEMRPFINNKKPETRDLRFKNYFENEIFHVVVHDYKNLTKPIERDLPAIKEKISTVTDINDLKFWLKQAVDYSILNTEHKVFIENIQTRLNPIEDLRNDIMHNRRVSDDNRTNYDKAKIQMDNWLIDFWAQEKARDFTNETSSIISYLLDQVFDNPIFEYDNSENIRFVDLNFEEKEMWDEEFKTYIYDQICETLKTSYGYEIEGDSEVRFYQELDNRLLSSIK